MGDDLLLNINTVEMFALDCFPTGREIIETSVSEVLHKGSLLDAWDLPEGNLLGRFSV